MEREKSRVLGKKCSYLGCGRLATRKAGIYGYYYCDRHAAVASAHVEEHYRRNLGMTWVDP